MPSKTRSTRTRSTAVVLPSAADLATPASIRALDEAQRKALAAKLAEGRDAGLSGDALREMYGEGCTGPIRRDLFRAFGLDSGRIARSYGEYRDGQARHGTARELVSGSKAEAARIAADAEAQAEADAEAAKVAAKAKRRAAAKRAAATRKARKA
jgi:hypothetical protein